MPDDTTTAPAPTRSGGILTRISAPEMPSALSLIIVVSFIIIVFMMIFHPPQTASQSALAIINMLLGALVAKFGTVIDWWFGANKQQQAQQDVISAIAQAPAPLAVAQVAPTVTQLGQAQLQNGELAYFNALTDDEAKKAFLNLTPVDRAAQIAKG